MALATNHPDSPTAEQPDTMTLAELARRMGISMTNAYQQARADTLPVPVIRSGRQFRFSRRAYDRLLDKQHGSPTD